MSKGFWMEGKGVCRRGIKVSAEGIKGGREGGGHGEEERISAIEMFAGQLLFPIPLICSLFYAKVLRNLKEN